MLIDWFTVGAQALNFIILVALMKRFLYQPILDAIDAREKHIATELAEASRKKDEAQHEQEKFKKKSDDIDRERAALLKQAGVDADVERQKLMDATRQVAEALAVRRQEGLVGEAKSLAQAVRQHAQTEVFAIARQTLSDLASVKLEASACEVFIERLRGLQGEPRNALAAALCGANGVVLVRSAFELPSAQRRAVSKAIVEMFGAKVELRYETAPALVGGIELVASGEKFAWSIGDYLGSLERGVAELLKARASGLAVTVAPSAVRLVPANAAARPSEAAAP